MAEEQRKSSNQNLIVGLQAVATLASIVIAVAALRAALDEAESVRKQQVASVWPRLIIGRSRTERGSLLEAGLVAANKGIGPALIEGVSVTLDDDPVTNWWEATRRIGGLEAGEMPLYASNQSIANSVLAPQDVADLFTLSTKALDTLPETVSPAMAKKMGERYPELVEALLASYDSGRLKIELCYCSVFGDCWVQRSDQPKPESVEECVGYPESQF